MKSFTELKLPLTLEKAISAMKFETPTPIQAQSIPEAMLGKDLIACAQTGSGKTVAFAIPMITRLMKNPLATGLVLAPTRELADQIIGVIQKLTIFLPEMRSALLIGGNAMQPQLRALRARPRIIVATPGRLVDHIQQRTVNLLKVEMLVLDEADRMLDMGFAPQLRQIVRHLPKARQTLLFSATYPIEIQQLVSEFLNQPVKVTIKDTAESKPKIEQAYIETTQQKKNDVLLDEINARQGSMLIFTRTQVRADRLARFLNDYGLDVARIHGSRTQAQRNTAIDGFRDGKFRILVATDIAARGIDIDHVAHVINYDLPMVAEDYTHRIGRTGRAGAEGQALSLLVPEDRQMWRLICKLNGGATPQPPTPHTPMHKVHSSRPERGNERSFGGGGHSQNRNRRPHRGQRSNGTAGDKHNSPPGGGARPARPARPARANHTPNDRPQLTLRKGPRPVSHGTPAPIRLVLAPKKLN